MTETIDTSAADAWMAGDGERAQAISQPIADNVGAEVLGDDQFQVHAPFRSTGETPTIERGEADKVVSTLTELGGEHQALVEQWQREGANVGEEVAYAKQAFAQYATPELIAKFDKSGLGNDPQIIRYLAKMGRLDAGMMGDFTVARNSAPTYEQPIRPVRGQSAAQAELNAIYQKNPPGTEGYKSPAVQARVRQLTEMIHGAEPAVGHGGRTI